MAATLGFLPAAAAEDVLDSPVLERAEPELESLAAARTIRRASTPVASAVDLSVLAIEDDPVDRFLVSDALSLYAEVGFAGDLDDGIALAWRGEFDAVLLDLGLPGRSGLDALHDFRAEGPDLPVVVLSGMYNDVLGVEALRDGAQDYLCKDGASGQLLRRSIRYAIERHVLQEELQELAVVDPLTGLLNRRGFDLHGHQAIARADRAEEPLALLYLDVDGLKAVNDTLGHGAGDDLLSELADLLRRTFRSSDIVARVGGDEFCVLFTEGAENSVIAVERLGRAIDQYNRSTDGLLIAVSAGVARWNPRWPLSLEELVCEADQRMLDQKGLGWARARKLSA